MAAAQLVRVQCGGPLLHLPQPQSEADYALRRLDHVWQDGGAYALLGPSGCGKTTLLRMIAGLTEPTEGAIRFGERDVTRVSPNKRNVGMVFQSYALWPHMTVRDNLAFGLRLRKTDAATIASRVAEAAAVLGLEPLLDRYPRALSGGQRQRVAMGRAIVRRSGLFLFDEPLSNLDPALRTQVRVDIRKQHDRLGATSVYVTHDQVEAMTLADLLFVLDGGVEGAVARVGKKHGYGEAEEGFAGAGPGAVLLLVGEEALAGGDVEPVAHGLTLPTGPA